MGKYPRQVVFTTTVEQFDQLAEVAGELRTHGVSRADILREAIDAGLAQAVKRLTPKPKRARGRRDYA